MRSGKKFNPLDHVLVPQHEKLSVEEAYKVLKELGVKPEDLPWIKASDPVAKRIGAKAGDLVRIKRKSGVTGYSIAYRYVISG